MALGPAGFDVQVDVLNSTVIGTLANSSLPSIEVVPPSNGFNVTWSALSMTLQIDAPSLLPFTQDKQRTLTALVVQATDLPFPRHAVLHTPSSVSHTYTTSLISTCQTVLLMLVWQQSNCAWPSGECTTP